MTRQDFSLQGLRWVGCIERSFRWTTQWRVYLRSRSVRPWSCQKIPTGTTWVLLIGDHEPPSTVRYQISMGEFSLIRVSGVDTVDFRNHAWPGVLTKISGVSVPESFGRWSDADQVAMEFAFPLPKRFTLALIASAFGPNVDQPFRIRIGQDEQSFRLLVF